MKTENYRPQVKLLFICWNVSFQEKPKILIFMRNLSSFKKNWQLIKICKYYNSNKYFCRPHVTMSHLFASLAPESRPSWPKALIWCHACWAAQVSSGKELSSESFLGGVENWWSASHPVGRDLKHTFWTPCCWSFELAEPVAWNTLEHIIFNIDSWVSARHRLFQEVSSLWRGMETTCTFDTCGVSGWECGL